MTIIENKKFIELSLCMLIISLIIPGYLFAEDSLSGQTMATYVVDGTIDVNNMIEYSGKIHAMAVKVALPDGVEFVSVSGAYPPAIAPKNGDTGLLEFAWVMTPPSPFQFAYTVNNNDNISGEIMTEVIYRRTGKALYEKLAPVSVKK